MAISHCISIHDEGRIVRIAWQGKVENDWRDEEPGRMLHEAHAGAACSSQLQPAFALLWRCDHFLFYPVVVSELWHWTENKDLIRPLLIPALLALQ